jgi:hypothetical protein
MKSSAVLCQTNKEQAGDRVAQTAISTAGEIRASIVDYRRRLFACTFTLDDHSTAAEVFECVVSCSETAQEFANRIWRQVK